MAYRQIVQWVTGTDAIQDALTEKFRNNCDGATMATSERLNRNIISKQEEVLRPRRSPLSESFNRGATNASILLRNSSVYQFQSIGSLVNIGNQRGLYLQYG